MRRGKNGRTRGMTPCRGPSSTLLRFTGRPSTSGAVCNSAWPSESDDRDRFVFVEVGSGSTGPGSCITGGSFSSSSISCRGTSASDELADFSCVELGSGSWRPAGFGTNGRGLSSTHPGVSSTIGKSVLTKASSSDMAHTSSSPTGEPHSFSSGTLLRSWNTTSGSGALYA